MTFEHCWEEFREEWRTREQERRRRVEDRVRRCRQFEWWDPRGWFCWIEIVVRYVLEVIIETFLDIIALAVCVLCEIGFILTGHRIIRSDLDRDVIGHVSGEELSVFNNADVRSRYGYTDSGRRTGLKLDANGVALYDKPEPIGGWWVVKPDDYPRDTPRYLIDLGKPIAISFTERRRIEITEAPPFEMIAVDGNRFFAKERGKDNFYFTSPKHEFLHALNDGRNSDFTVPGFYVKLDPEYNQRLFDIGFHDLNWWSRRDYDHPGMDLFSMPVTGGSGIKLAKRAGLFPEIMQVKVEPNVWYLIDSRPPFGSGNPPQWIEAYDHVAYGGKYLGICESVSQRSINIIEVLDIAVGNMHRHVHYEHTNGGEDGGGPNPILNGPIEDAAGFWDGTCNFYILCRIRIDSNLNGVYDNSSYGILWIDEQSYFSERWRLLHPDDKKWAVKRGFAWIGNIDRSKFWCPFEDSWFNDAGRMNNNSRMAVSRQTVLVTGENPNGDPEHVLYSINFSWGSADKTWRWTKYPKGAEVALGMDVKDPQKDSSYYLPQTIEIREDMTIFMKGKLADGNNGHIDGKWVRKYLPADNAEVPRAEELVEVRDSNGNLRSEAMSDQPYPHEWNFFSNRQFNIAHAYSHFGVYERVDSRSQYYFVQVLEDSPNPFPDNYPENIQWMDSENNLYILTAQPPFIHKPPSMFNKRTYLKIVKRGKIGMIAMLWDKRDDDLLEFTGSKILTITNDTEGKINGESVNDNTTYPSVTVKIRLTDRKKDWTPPVVQMVKVIVDRNTPKITIMFYSRSINDSEDLPDEEDYAPELDVTVARDLNYEQLGEYADFATYLNGRYVHPHETAFPNPDNLADAKFSPDTSIWRMKIGWFDDAGEAKFISKNIWDEYRGVWNFTRKSRYLYVCEWTPSGADDEDFELAEEHCDESNVFQYATSIWFEDHTGHVSTAEKTLFKSIS